MEFNSSVEFARQLDSDDPLKETRSKFIIPEVDGRQQVYLLGNSLGLQPVSAKSYLDKILADWSSLGVESFFHAKEPWMDYHDQLTGPLTKIVGAHADEIVVMNQLSVNLHLMMVSFYRPDNKRFKIICEAKAFPSDQYVFESQVRSHGLDPETAIIEVGPREGESVIHTEDIIAAINEHGDETALVIFSGVNYYSGQVFDMEAISKAARNKGSRVGLDLAHAAGNIELKLHDWQVDFACWCSYKYLNAGPGAIGGVFIHRNNHDDRVVRFAGWWGYDKSTRFRMEKGFKPMAGAEGWQLSTPALFLYATHRASLEIFEEAGWEKVQQKRRLLTAYTWFLLKEFNEGLEKKIIRFITPEEEQHHGCQVSMLMLERGREIYEALIRRHVIVDWREPNVIRFAPVPLYNTFSEVHQLVSVLRELVS
ncbi:MAG: kynureninase [Chitinophagaceae bacterium]|nr:MAG: kynureninase [Chitinophagaceae bacterium]